LKRLLWEGKRAVVVYYDRVESRLRELDLGLVERVTNESIILAGGDVVIPIHRVVEVRDEEGRIIWRRERNPPTGG